MSKILFLLIILRYRCFGAAKNKTPECSPQGQISLLGVTATPRINLTQRAIAKLPAPHPDGQQPMHWEDEFHGFGVQCSGQDQPETVYCAARSAQRQDAKGNAWSRERAGARRGKEARCGRAR